MSEKENLKKFAKALDELVEFGEAVAADGKVDLSDAAHLPKLVPVVQALYDSYSAKDAVVEELKKFLQEKADELTE